MARLNTARHQGPTTRSPPPTSPNKANRDSTGSILDAHDSQMWFNNGTFYWWAASYGDCIEPPGDNGCADVSIGACGFQTNHNVTLYTSSDLVHWENQGVVFGALGNLPTDSVLFAPKTVYNPVTGMYVMWFNYIVGSFSNSFYGVATSPVPQGPFTLKVQNVKGLQFPDDGDEALFVDSDGKGYLIYTSIAENHGMSIEQLTPDYLGTLGAAASSGIFGNSGVEAPMMFKRNGIYYAVFGSCCCYCGSGNPVTVHTATSPLGPYTQRNTFPDLHSQSTAIVGYTDGNGDAAFVYIGDHWESAPDRVKGHDFTVFSPLVFDATGNVTTPGFLDSFTITITLP